MSKQKQTDLFRQKLDGLLDQAKNNNGITLDEVFVQMSGDSFTEEQIARAITELEKQKYLLPEYDEFPDGPEAAAANPAADAATDNRVLDSLQMQMKGISQYRLLSHEEQQELSRLILEENDQNARDAMINHNMRLVASIAKKFHWSNLPLQDLIQEGTTGLIKAVDGFDYRKGYRFSSYATVVVRRSIYKHFKEMAFDQKLSDQAYKDVRQIQNLLDSAQKEQRTPPGVDEMAEALSISRKRILAALSIIDASVSLNSQVGDEEDSAEKGDFIRNPDARSPEDDLISGIDQGLLDTLLRSLLPREALALRLFFDAQGNAKHAVKDAAAIMELSEERYVALKNKAIRRLWNSTRYQALKELLQHD